MYEVSCCAIAFVFTSAFSGAITRGELSGTEVREEGNAMPAAKGEHARSLSVAVNKEMGVYCSPASQPVCRKSFHIIYSCCLKPHLG